MADTAYTPPKKIIIQGIGQVNVPPSIRTKDELSNYVKAYAAARPSRAEDISNIALSAAAKAPAAVLSGPVEVARMAQGAGDWVQGKLFGQELVDKTRQVSGGSPVDLLASAPAGYSELTGVSRKAFGPIVDYKAKTELGQDLQAPIEAGMFAAASRNPLRALVNPVKTLSGIVRDVPQAAAGAYLGEKASQALDFGENAPLVGAGVDIGSQILMSIAGRGKGATGIAAKKAPSLADLESANKAAWQSLDDLGARVSSGTIKNALDQIPDIQAYRNPGAYARTSVYLNELTNPRLPNRNTFSLLQSVRSRALADLRGGAAKGADQQGLSDVIDAIDDAIERGAYQPTTSGISPKSSQEIAGMANQARSMHRQVVKTRMMENIISDALSASRAGEDVNKAVQRGIRTLLRSEKKRKGFTAQELSYLEDGLNRKAIGDKIASTISSIGGAGAFGSGDLATALAVKTAANLTASATRRLMQGNAMRGVSDASTAIRAGADAMMAAQEQAYKNRMTSRNAFARGAAAAPYSFGLLGGPEEEQQQ